MSPTARKDRDDGDDGGGDEDDDVGEIALRCNIRRADGETKARAIAIDANRGRIWMDFIYLLSLIKLRLLYRREIIVLLYVTVRGVWCGRRRDIFCDLIMREDGCGLTIEDALFHAL